MLRRLGALLILATTACYVAPNAANNGPMPYPGTSCIDDDRDGFCVDVDCDDNSPSVHPGAADILADGIDQNCDGAL